MPVTDFLIDLGAALVAVLFFLYWQRKRLMKLWKYRKWVLRITLVSVAIWLLIGVPVHIVVGRVLVMGMLFFFWTLWKRRYKANKGKQRRLAHVPPKNRATVQGRGLYNDPRERSSIETGKQVSDFREELPTDRQLDTQQNLEAATGDERRGAESVSIGMRLRRLWENKLGKKIHKRAD